MKAPTPKCRASWVSISSVSSASRLARSRCSASTEERNSKKPWSKPLRRWVAGIRQIVETVYDKLFNTFGLWGERPHEIEGLRARLAARVALHNFCIWLNDQLGRPRLKFADLMGW
jgi:hypothetical protein